MSTTLESPPDSPSGRTPCSTACVFDSDGDGNCHRCAKRGGCAAIGGPFHASETQQYVHGLIVANANGWIDAVARGSGYEGIAKQHLEGMAECVLRIQQGIVR